MNSHKLLQQTLSLTLVILLMVGCSGAPAESTTASAPPVAAPTSAPVTATTAPAPATATSVPATATSTPVTAAATSTQAADAGQWQVIRQVDIRHAATIAGFLNDTFGITAGSDGEIHYTTDGGKTWLMANNSSWCRFGLDIVDKQVAWTCGNPGHVRVTTDGGRNWRAVTDFGSMEPNHCRFLSFLDSKTGWAATPDQLAATRDGGATWTKIALPDGIQKIAAIALRTVTDGYVLDTGGELFVTQDGAKTWSVRALAPKVENGGKPIVWYFPTAAVRFLDPNHGLVVMTFESSETGADQVLAMHTADGGQTWNQENVPGFGALYLAHDGATLTISISRKQITVLRYQKR